MRPFFLLKPVKLKLEGQAYHRIWTQSGNHRPKTSHCLHYQPKTHFQTFIEPSFPYKNQAQTLGRAPKIWTVTHLSPVSCRNCLAGRLFSPRPSTGQLRSFISSLNANILKAYNEPRHLCLFCPLSPWTFLNDPQQKLSLISQLLRASCHSCILKWPLLLINGPHGIQSSLRHSGFLSSDVLKV